METAGYGLIETLRVRAERIPFLERHLARLAASTAALGLPRPAQDPAALLRPFAGTEDAVRSEEHTSELQSRLHLVCRLLLEKKKKQQKNTQNQLPKP